MKIRLMSLLVFCCSFSLSVKAYYKYCYSAYDYAKPDKERQHLFMNTMKVAAPFNPDQADYCINVQNSGGCYVKLKGRDKKRVAKKLVLYDGAMPVTNDLINYFLSSRREKYRIVGWVLQDFKTTNTTVTVGDILGKFTRK